MQGNAAQAFPGVAELLNGARRIAREQPELVECFSFGRSRSGESLPALRVGSGPRRVLVYAFPQPDEPLGGVTVLHLVGLLLEETELVREATWTLAPCVDPDGARLNEGWFCQPWDLRDYARRHFRPPEGEQVEWTFPNTDTDWSWERTLPETRALEALLEEVRPHVLLPLHNALLGGAYAFLSPGAELLAPRLAPIWRARGFRTHLGEPELPFAPSLAPGVYRLPSLREIASALAANGLPDPAGLLQCGAPAYLHASRLCAPTVLVPELPLFAVDGVDDTRPTNLTRRQVLSDALDADRKAFAQWEVFVAQATPFLRQDESYRRTVEAHGRIARPLMEATGRWLTTDAALDRPATVAEFVDSSRIAPYVRLLPLGTLLQALEVAACRGIPSREHLTVVEEVANHLERALDDVLLALEPRPVPLDQLVDTVAELAGLAVRESPVRAGQGGTNDAS
jgi:hypothetical protein